MTKDEALKMALDLAEEYVKEHGYGKVVVNAIKEALAQPEQEPVAWLHNGKLHEVDPIDWATGTVTPLYPSAQFSKPWVDYIALARKVKVYEDALGEIAWSNNSEWQQDRAKQVLAQMRGVEL